MLTVTITCPVCGRTHVVTVDEWGYYCWLYCGNLIQEALPDLSATEREQLISGLCPDCQRSVFGE